ncbi:MAG: carboxypeptidase-like regulatory domain-containing protein, partial [Candidatus Kapaibacterium sp.]
MTRIFLFLLAAALVSSSMLAGCNSPSSPSSNGTSAGGLFVPDTVNFGLLANGQTKDTLISILNETADTITISGNSLSSSQAMDTNFSHPLSIAPHGWIIVHIEFTPSASGSNTAMDSIHYRLAGTSYVAVMTLEANASGTSGGAGNLVAVPNLINFGTLPIGQWHDTTATIVNAGSAPITIISSTISSTEAQDTNFFHTVTINNGNGITIHLQFNPAQAGFQTAVDSIHYLAGGTLHSIPIIMTATGVSTSTKTEGGGAYTIPLLHVGPYQVTAEFHGFKKFL